MTSSTGAADTNAQLLRALTSLKDLRGRLETSEGARTEPIAIIGMGCRLPGAPDPQAYWQLIRNGGDAISETPADRWDTADLYDPSPDASGKVATRWGGFLADIDRFDAAFFGISPREAAQMDPQQRLMLEVAWEAFEDGGQSVERLAGTNTGVFVGVHSHSEDYYRMQAADPRDLDLYSGTGTSHSVVSGRVSYLLDLRGPSLAVDTACSSSLVAVHLAVQSLRNRECSLALVGGVNAIIDPTFTVVASRMRMMSASGRCRPFDEQADGFVRAEGCAAVLLKRLSDAVADGDRVLAVIKGSAVNQDGRSNGLTAPNSLSQQAVVRAALANARIEPSAIGLVEAHGTGTPLGDPIELEALAEVFRDVEQTARCALGSVKANIGHAEGAAGVAALVKTVLALRAGEIPPLVHFENLNPHISLDGTPFVIPDALSAWPVRDHGRHAGISSFGWSGTNAHVVVGEAPAPVMPSDPSTGSARRVGAPLLLPISARNANARLELAATYRALLAEAPAASVPEICAAAAVRRSHHDHRLAASGRTPDDLIEQLDAFLGAQLHRGLSVGEITTGRRELLVFVFPGQGSQWVGMARDLYESEPAFRAAIGRCEQAMTPFVDWSLVEQIMQGGQRFDEIDVIQPVLFAIQVALAAWWSARGVQPDAVVGHSMGEVAAAHVAGILSLDDAARVICRRSGLLRRISGQGAMGVVELDIDAARQAIVGLEDRLSIAVSNSPTSTVLSGEPQALDQVLQKLAAGGTFCRRVNVDVASHSPQVDALRDELLAALDGIRPNPTRMSFVSTVTAKFEDGPDLDAQYWARNLRQPVLFTDATRLLIEGDHVRFVELSPHPVLLAAADEALTSMDRRGVTIPSMQRDFDEPATLWSALGALYAAGHTVDWRLIQENRTSAVDLPMYPWQRERHWVDPRTRPGSRRSEQTDHPLLGWSVPIAAGDLVHVWENEFEPHHDLSIFDQRIGDDSVVPAAALVALMLAAAATQGRRGLTDIRFDSPVRVVDHELVTTQVVLDPARGTLAAYLGPSDSRVRGATSDLAADLPDADLADAAADATAATLVAHRERIVAPVASPDLYRRFRELGLDVGTSRQTIAGYRHEHDALIAEIVLAPRAEVASADDVAVIDACLQAAVLAAVELGLPELRVPVGAAAVRTWARPTDRMTCRVSPVQPSVDGSTPSSCFDVVMHDDAGRVVVTIDRLALETSAAVGTRVEDLVYRIEWHAVAAPRPARATPVDAWLILADRHGVGAALATELTDRGARCVTMSRDDELAVVLERFAAAGVPAAQLEVAFLWGLDAPAGPPSSVRDLEQAHVHGCGALLDLVNEMSGLGRRVPIWVVTRGAQAVLGDDRAAVTQAPLWGFGRAIAEESPDMWGGLIDLDPSADAAHAAGHLADELHGVAGSGTHIGGHDPIDPVEGEVARRGEHRYVARLVRHELAPGLPLRIRADGTCLVTGAFGAVGRQLTRRLVDAGARRLLLLGRTELPQRHLWSSIDPDTPAGRRVDLVRRLESCGVAVHVAAVDVADEMALRACLRQFEAEGWPAVRSVFHAAAVLGGQLIGDLDQASMREQIVPKVIGAWTLAEELGELEHFVMFSSLAAVLPMPGQSAYAAANAFLDAFAHQRRAQGLAALSVNWGFWMGTDELLAGEVGQGRGDGGPAYKNTANALAEARGVHGFLPEHGFEALQRLMAGSAPQALVASIDWAEFGAAQSTRLLALVADRVGERVGRQSVDAAVTRTSTFAAELAVAAAEHRVEIVEAGLRRVLGRVLKLPESRIEARQPFGALGLDSLMSVELRNRLEIELGLKLSATVAWNYPSVRELGGYVLSRLVPAEAVASAEHRVVADGAGGSASRITAAVAELSDDEVLAALMGEAPR